MRLAILSAVGPAVALGCQLGVVATESLDGDCPCRPDFCVVQAYALSAAANFPPFSLRYPPVASGAVLTARLLRDQPQVDSTATAAAEHPTLFSADGGGTQHPAFPDGKEDVLEMSLTLGSRLKTDAWAETGILRQAPRTIRLSAE